MRLFRQLMTIPVGESVSNSINLGSEKLSGILVREASDGAPTNITGVALTAQLLTDPHAS